MMKTVTSENPTMKVLCFVNRNTRSAMSIVHAAQMSMIYPNNVLVSEYCIGVIEYMI